MVDEFLDSPDLMLQDMGEDEACDTETEDDPVVDADALTEEKTVLPTTPTEDALAILDSHVVTSADQVPRFDDTSNWPRHLVLNYEAFQQPDSHAKVRSLVERHMIDFVVVDEIHYSKQHEAEDMSRRRQMVTAQGVRGLGILSLRGE